MPAPNKSGLETKTQSCVDAATLSTSTENLLSLAVAKSQLCSSFCNSVATCTDLPDIFEAKIPNGQLAFVADIEEIVMASDNCWIGLDGRLLRNDVPLRKLWAWGGGNFVGTLGDGTTTNRASPVTTFGGGTNWCQIGVQTSAYHSAGIKMDGTLWTWGHNCCGALGVGDTSNRFSPVEVSGGGTNWCQTAVGNRSSGAVKTDGTLWTWGCNDTNQLAAGLSIFDNRSAPTYVTTTGSPNWKSVSMSGNHGVAVKNDGTMCTWGFNGSGQLGFGTLSPVCCNNPTAVVGGATNWSIPAAGSAHSAGIKTDGTLWTWGRNSDGRLGDGTTTYRSSPVTVAGGGTNWCVISLGNQASAGVKFDGTLWTWGLALCGALGDGQTVTNRSSPGTVAGGGTTWCTVSISCAPATAAIKTDGTLWTWGWNGSCALATGTLVNRSSPGTTVGPNISWWKVGVGSHHMLGITQE